MATTEAALEGGQQVGRTAEHEEGLYEGGLWSWITTVDHKRIGIMYAVTALFFFLVGGLEALMIRLQLVSPDAGVVSAQMYNELFTMHGTTMVFLAVMPLSVAFFNYIVPLQIGARDVAFPRLNAFSYWTFLFGGLFLNASWFFGAAPDVGWFAYANLTSSAYSPGAGVDFWIIGLQLLGVSSLVGALNFAVTILNLRAPGMKMMRLPVFSWMTLITSILIILAFPVITVALTLLMFDRFFDTTFFNVAANGSVLLWQHLFWIFGHPEVYILILPAMGIISEVFPTFSRKALFGYPVIVYSGALIAFIGFGVWAHHMFSVGMGAIPNAVFGAMTMLVAVPTGVKIFNWIATMWGGSLRFRTPLLFAIGFVAMFIIGGLSGVMHASPPADLQQTDTYFVVAHFHYVLFGGTMFGVFAGFYYWFPKVTGRMMSETLGKWHFWTTFVGFNLTFFPMHFVGLLGMPRRTFTYPEGMGFEIYNQIETVGAFLLGASTLILVWNLWRSARGGEEATANPWEAPTLEWSIPSPPEHFNFGEIPEVSARDPLWHVDGARVERGAGEPEMPAPSYWPIVTSFGLLVMAAGALIGLWLVFAGLAVTLLGVFRWSFEPAYR
jgi:cytochrome c oxidase subunit 1